ncbi:MAG: YbaB/EbfC family nucleoid-associated protein [Christensenellaceae bacterium]|jgi:DNA-binding YbaB/EbfC family protein|nr:YbaB/EbfC family nucleoid-associated protein [Christensenellaceae bacterium]
MGKFGGFGSGGGNMQNMMRQAQKMQEEMLKAQEALAKEQVTASAGGGMVDIVMTCEKQLVSIKIKPEATDPEDVEMLEDLILAAFNEASTLIDQKREEFMGPFNSLGLGGLF